ncbi:MAG: hypothetical protein AAGJ82_13120 [Bacteroidota bacterium]
MNYSRFLLCLFYLLLLLVVACDDEVIEPLPPPPTYAVNLEGVFMVATHQDNTSFGLAECADSLWTGYAEFRLVDSLAATATQFGGEYYRVYSSDMASGPFFEDPSMGGYNACYMNADSTIFPNGANGEGQLRLANSDGALYWAGASQWGEVYFMDSVRVAEQELYLVYQNDYAERFRVTLTRLDTLFWPLNLRVGQ